ncbi:MAG: transposase, partial [Actinomycetota bacterium]|nr:transposase [Actinomycetota bacterium]
YRFDALVAFSYRQDEWLSQVEANRAVAYNVMFGERGRVYLDASFTPAASPAVPALTTLT